MLEKLFKSSSSVCNYNPWNAAKVSETNSRAICWVIARWQVKAVKGKALSYFQRFTLFYCSESSSLPTSLLFVSRFFWKLLKNVNPTDSPWDSADAPWFPLPHVWAISLVNNKKKSIVISVKNNSQINLITSHLSPFYKIKPCLIFLVQWCGYQLIQLLQALIFSALKPPTTVSRDHQAQHHHPTSHSGL